MSFSALLLSVLLGFSQTAEVPAVPPKPLRERLLERAKKGEADAQFDLGKNYETGRIGLPRDPVQAEHWYQEAANQNDPYAEASLAIMLNFGRGIPVDVVQAFALYQRAVMHSKGADRDSIQELRDNLAKRLTKQQLAESQRVLDEWKRSQKP
jgi:uncharacterized protein